MFENIIVDSDNEAYKNFRADYGHSQDSVAVQMRLAGPHLVSYFEAGGGMDRRNYTLFLLLTGNHPSYQLHMRHDKVRIEDLVKTIDYGSRVKELRTKTFYKNKKRCISQGHFADMLGLIGGKQLVSRYERNKQKPSCRTWTLALLCTDTHPEFYLTKK